MNQVYVMFGRYCQRPAGRKIRRSPVVRLHLAMVNRAGWFVSADDDAEIRYREAGRAHRRREDAVVVSSHG